MESRNAIGKVAIRNLEIINHIAHEDNVFSITFSQEANSAISKISIANKRLTIFFNDKTSPDFISNQNFLVEHQEGHLVTIIPRNSQALLALFDLLNQFETPPEIDIFTYCKIIWLMHSGSIADFEEKVIHDFLKGTDRLKPIEITVLESGRNIQRIGLSRGNFYSPVDQRATESSVSDYQLDQYGFIKEKPTHTFRVQRALVAIKSVAERIDDDWSIPHSQIKCEGGGEQYLLLVPENTKGDYLTLINKDIEDKEQFIPKSEDDLLLLGLDRSVRYLCDESDTKQIELYLKKYYNQISMFERFAAEICVNKLNPQFQYLLEHEFELLFPLSDPIDSIDYALEFIINCAINADNYNVISTIIKQLSTRNSELYFYSLEWTLVSLFKCENKKHEAIEFLNQYRAQLESTHLIDIAARLLKDHHTEGFKVFIKQVNLTPEEALSLFEESMQIKSYQGVLDDKYRMYVLKTFESCDLIENQIENIFNLIVKKYPGLIEYFWNKYQENISIPSAWSAVHMLLFYPNDYPNHGSAQFILGDVNDVSSLLHRSKDITITINCKVYLFIIERLLSELEFMGVSNDKTLREDYVCLKGVDVKVRTAELEKPTILFLAEKEFNYQPYLSSYLGKLSIFKSEPIRAKQSKRDVLDEIHKKVVLYK